MNEPVFKSSLSLEQVDSNFEKMDFFGELMDGLTEALAHAKGRAKADTLVRKRSLPSVDVSHVRGSLKMTQKDFASVLGVSTRTVEAWEAGRTEPTPTAKKLIYLIDQDNSLVQKLIER